MNLHKIDIQNLVWTLLLLSIGGLLGLMLSIAWNSGLTEVLKTVIAPFGAAALGGGVAYFGIRRNQRIQQEQDKVDLLNDAIFKVSFCIGDLCYIKSAYFEELGDDYRRTLGIKKYPRRFNLVDPDISGLQFLIRSSPNSSGVEIHKLYAWLQNFNQVVHVIDERERLLQKVENVARRVGRLEKDMGIDVDLMAVDKELGAGTIATLLAIGEDLLCYVDNTLSGLDEVLGELIENGPKMIDKGLLRVPRIVNKTRDAGSKEEELITVKMPNLKPSEPEQEGFAQ